MNWLQLTFRKLLDMDRCFNTPWEKTIHLLQMPLHQCFQIVIYTHNNLYFIYLTPALFHSMQHIWLFLGTIFFLFAINFILLTRNKTKKDLPISHRIINYQTFFRPFTINYLFIIKMMTKNEMRDVVIIWSFSEILFHLFSFACCRTKFLLSNFFLIPIWFLLSVMTNNQNKGGRGNDDWMNNYGLP